MYLYINVNDYEYRKIPNCFIGRYQLLMLKCFAEL